MTTLRWIISYWFFCFANCSDQIGAATRESFAVIGLAIQPKPKPRKPAAPKPGWLAEAGIVRRKKKATTPFEPDPPLEEA
jgi:hypothetical protein